MTVHPGPDGDNPPITRRPGAARDRETSSWKALLGRDVGADRRVSAAAGERRRRVATRREFLRELA